MSRRASADAQFFDQRADFTLHPSFADEAAYGDGWYPGLGEHEAENTGGFVAREFSFPTPTTSKWAVLHL